MLDLSYDSYKSSNKPTKKKNDLSYSSYSAGKQKLEAVNTEKTTLRSQGEPVSLKDNRATPTMGGKILRGAANLIANPVTNIVNAGQIALGKKETKPFSGDYLGKVEGLGKVDMTKSPLDKENLKTIKKSVGTGLELASYAGYGGIAKGAIKGAVTKTTSLAAKQTFKEYALQNLPKLLKEGALTSAAYTGGSQLNENAKSGKKFSWEQAARDVTIGTVLTPIAAIGLRKISGIFGKSTSDILAARKEVREAADAAILNRPIPNVGTPFDNFKFNPNDTGFNNNSIVPKANIPAPVNIDSGVGKLHGPKNVEWGNYNHDYLKAKELGGKGAFIDVGHDVNGVEKLTTEQITNTIKKYGGDIEQFKFFARTADGEPTTAFKLKKELSDEVMYKISKELEQDAIPQWSNLGKLDINIAPGAKWNTPKVSPSNQFEQRAVKATSKEDFINTEVGFLNRTKQPITNSTIKNLNKAWEKMHPAPIQEVTPKTPKTNSKPTVDSPSFKETPNNINTEAPKTNYTPEQQKMVDDVIETLGKQDENIAPELRLGDLKTRGERVIKEYASDPNKLERIAMGIERHPEIPQEDALGALKKLADDSGDWRLSDRLSNSNVGSQAGSNFNGLKLAGKETTADIIRDLKLSIKERSPQAFKMSQKETDEAVTKLRKYFSQNNIPEKEFNNIMDNFKC